MGVTIRSKSNYLNVGYSDFAHLRVLIARHVNPWFGDAYEQFCFPVLVRKKPDQDLKSRYMDELESAIDLYGIRKMKALDAFLRAPDCGGEATYGCCRFILDLLKEEDDTEIIGYPGWGSSAPRMHHLKKLLQDCVDEKYPLLWY